MPTDESLKTVPRRTRIIARIGQVALQIFSSTYQLRYVGRAEHMLGLMDRDDSVLMTCWHNRMFYLTAYYFSFLQAGGFKVAILSSDSKDGEIGATIGKYMGARVVRGSSSRRGASGFRGLYRTIVKEKYSIILLPDGSKGPVYKAKVGIAGLAKMTGKPILPISWWASDYWRIGSWDRMIFPKPGAQIVLTVGDLIYVPRDTNDEDLERYRLQVETVLDELGFLAHEPFKKVCTCI